MAQRDSVELSLMKNLPAKARRALNLNDLKVLTGAVLIHDRIEQHFDACYRSEAQLRAFKVKHGYCGGRPYCLAFTRSGEACHVCKEEMKPSNRRRKNKHSEYGLLQLKKRRAEAAAKSK